MLSQLVRTAPHEWSFSGTWHDGRHHCYFCKPRSFPPMPPEHTLCARCGNLIKIGSRDPMNKAMIVCPPCEEDLALDEMA